MEHGRPLISSPQEQILPQKTPYKFPTRNIFFLMFYMAVVPVFIVFLLLFSLSVKYESNGYVSRQAHKPKFQALPSDNNQSGVNIEPTDARVKALDDFFQKYNSPLYGHAQTIVDEADKNDIDYRLLPAIAMQESTLCRKVIKNSYNCWGFGIYGGKVRRFANYDEGIKTVTSTLARKYVQKGMVNPHEIVQMYTPSDTGKWPQVVSLIMQKLSDSL